ncbi:glycosyltransferase-like protein [Thalictrum thalictroides]|uniref:Glycosyltransferase-like protein n=1 Tax=Thalictrum thalictroides TaxID=46969 RepID=A0A7J6XFP1_THATH|nr:glycosyltransferase-like protein [Thalictrum thalictroides]
MAMLRHEETFKEQVFELHRLYQVQKMLMKHIKSDRASRREQERWNYENVNYVNEANYISQEQQKLRRKLDLELQPAKGYMNEDGDGTVVEIEDENDIELTLGPANKYLRRKKNEMPIISAVGPSFSSSSTESNYVQRTSTTNTSNRGNRREDLTEQWGKIQVPNIHSKFGTKVFDVEEQMKQERLNHPPWLLQVLSLKMT